MGKPKILESMEKNIMTAYPTNSQWVTSMMTINLTASISVGDKLTLSNNAIVIGAGVSKVKISGIIFYDSFSDTNGYVWGQIHKNGGNIVGTITAKSNPGFQSCSMPPVLATVKEGDMITLNSGDMINAGANIRPSIENTQLTVEVVE